MKTRLDASVLWREGMFLYPQHLQAFSRELSARIYKGDAAGTVGDWGLLHLTIDEEALARDVFSLPKAAALFRDGTLAEFPANAVVEPREFAEHFGGPELMVYLGVPSAQQGVPQIGDGAERMHRFQVERQEVIDENEREAVRDLEFRILHGRLFFGEEDRSGFESLPIAKLVRVGRPKARSALSPDYIPPVLVCGASGVLMAGLLKAAVKARAQARDLAVRIPDMARLSSVEKGADLAGLVKLQALNQCVAVLDQVARQEQLPTFQAYLALVQTVGNLAVFAPERVVPELPSYDHADPDACFRAAFEAVDALLVAEVAVPYDVCPFIGDPLRQGLYKCELPGDWLERHALFYLGVELADEPEHVRDLVASGVKLLAGGDMERVLQGVTPGIGLEHLRLAPLSFPKRKTLHFFRIDTEGAAREAWLRLADSREAVILSALGDVDQVSFHFYVEFPD